MSMYRDFIDANLSALTETNGGGDVCKCGWLGAGAGVACWWLESNRSETIDETRDVTFAQMLAIFQVNAPEMVIPEARSLFYTGFYWLLEFEVPSDDVPVH